MGIKKTLIFSFLICMNTVLWAQSNETIDGFLNQDIADWGTALLLVGQASGELPLDAEVDDVSTWVDDSKWKKEVMKDSFDGAVTQGTFFLVLFDAFDIKGGILYSIFKTPRYAVLEADYQGFLVDKPYINKQLNPQDVLYYLSQAMEAEND